MISLGDRDLPPKKIFTWIQNPLAWWQWVKPGILVQDLEYQSPSLNYMLTTTEDSQEHFPEGSEVIFVLWKAKQNGDAFSESLCGLRQSAYQAATRLFLICNAHVGTSPWNHQETHLSCIFLGPCCTFLIRCTHFRQPLLLLCQTEAQTNAWGTLVWSDVTVDKD